MSARNNVTHEAVEIDADRLETSAGRLVCVIKPTWASKTLIFKKLSTDDGIIHYAIFPNDDEDELHGVVIKLYPTNSDVYTNHQQKLQLINQLSHHTISPHVLLTFTNGYFSNYIPGAVLDLNEEHAHQLIARKLAEFHSISSKINDGPHFVDKLKSYIELFTKKNMALQDRLVEIKEKYEEAFKNDTSFFTTLKSAVGLNPTPTLPMTLEQLELQLKDTSWAQLSTEIDFLRTVFQNNWSTHGLPMILCLNDLHIRNFQFDSKNQLMSIIDFDHCSYNYNLIDIVSFFLELAKDDYETKYPDRHIQKLFLTEYLKYSSLNLSTIVYDHLVPTDRELEKLCDLCGLLIAPVHLYWALWAFLQALLTKPTSTFDYINYGKIRLGQYRKHKENFFLPLYHSQKNIHEH